MQQEYLIYGRKQDQPTYMESLLAEYVYTSEQIDKVKEAARKDGFIHFRVVAFNSGKPDFIGAINI